MRVIIEMVGTSPLLMHNVQLADPTNEFVKAIATLTAKHKKHKTEADHLEIQRLEFTAGLNLGAKGPVISAPAIHKCLANAAKMRREGPAVLRALLPTTLEYPLDYKGPRTPTELWTNKPFRYLTAVRVGAARVMRMRPRFIGWSLTSEWELVVEALDFAALQRIVGEAGLVEGLGDGRNKGFGRFAGTAVAAGRAMAAE